MVKKTLHLCAALALSLGVIAAPPRHKLKVDIGAQSVSVAKATPNGRVILVGYERTFRGHARLLRRVERDTVATADGSARFDIDAPIATNSFWVVVDRTTAAFGAVTANGRKLREGELPAHYIHREANGKKKLVARLDYVHAVLVRPGGGSWQLISGDGGSFDADGALDGKIELPPSEFEPHGQPAEKLTEFREGDLLLVFAPRQMGYFVAEVVR